MTTHRRSRLASLAALLLSAIAFAATDAAADEPLAPTVGAEDPTLPEFEPYVPRTRMADPTLAVVGGTMMVVGAAGVVTGAVMIAGADDNPGAPDFVSGPVLVLGSVICAAGLPLLAIGARDVPVTSASPVPVIRVGATAADATWRF